MRLFATAFRIASKHSSRRLLCLLCVLVLVGALGFAVSSAQTGDRSPAAKVAIINLDQNPVTRMALRSVTSPSQLSSLFDVQFLTPDQDVDGYTAVMIIPDGFLNSILDGSNLSPTVTVNVTTPLEAMWVRQMVGAGSDYLTSAQLGIYTVQKGVDYGRALTPKQYDLLVADVNITIMKAFLNRLSLVETQMLSASGGLSLPQYYGTALFPVLLLCYAFLYAPAVDDLRRLEQARPSGKEASSLFLAAWAHLFVLTLGLTLLLSVPICWVYGFSLQKLAAMLLFAVLMSAVSFLLTLLFPRGAACASACILLAVGMGLCTGGFLPLALMPLAFAQIAPFAVTFQGQRLAAVLLDEPLSVSAIVQSAAMGALAFVICVCLWRHRKAAK
ncbi:ABC transporter permease [Oscillospiraceae bacterium PP1C4]